ncbi:MAG TPA: 50S ribosomal protein L13 [Patescibacteria group bacterium]|nr:50S ribosomal protein L13 [Patescibacteria group bacterium]
MKSYVAKPSEIEKKWLLIDAEGLVLGRLASLVALRLRGKHKPMFTPNIDCGDNVIIINAEKVKLTGKKAKFDIFYWHTGFPGGIKGLSKGQILEGKFPGRVIQNAVRRMMPKDSPLARQQLTCLRVYAGAAHPHEAQKPEVVDIAAMNPKNKR